MSPLSAPVLGGAALVSAPALWGMFDDGTSPSVALTRYLVCVLVCWVGLEVVAMLVGPVGPAKGPEPAEDLADRVDPDHR
ncbi:MAG: hypothetical protein ACXVWU_01020 [Nocardioides sp.]